MTPLCGKGITSTKAQVEVMFMFIFLLFGLFTLLCCSRPYTIYISYAYGTVEPICTESAVKQEANQTNLQN